jgi:hypothetical protein
MAKSTAKATGHKPTTKPTKAYRSPTVSDDETHPTVEDLPKSARLANAYTEYLDPLNKKTVRALAKEYQCGRTALQDRVNGKSKPLAKEVTNRIRLTLIEELALVEWCHQLDA